MRRYGRSFGRRSLVAVLALVLAGGEACACECQTTVVPAGDSFVLTAVVVPGPGGAEVYASDRCDEEVDLRIGFGSDGLLLVNGAVVGPYLAADTYTITVSAHSADGSWLADMTIVNTTTGQTEYVRHGHVLLAKPATATAASLEVVSLTCE